MNAEQLLRPWRFNQILARARSAKVPGAWSGSAFRRHPCGLLVGNMRLANHWHVDDYCSIVIGTTNKWSSYCTDSFSYGDPYPHPVEGAEVQIWCNGRWVSEEFQDALEEKVVAILNRALTQSAARESWDKAVEAHAQFCYRQKAEATKTAALALAIGPQT